MTTAQVVRTWRTAKGITQAELAQLAHTGQATISRIESGRIIPTLPVLERVAAALDCNVVVDFAPRR